VPPIVAKIVDETIESPSETSTLLTATLLSSITSVSPSNPSQSGTPKILAILLKLVQVAVRPSHHGLDCVVKATQRDCARNQDTAPDGRFDAKESDRQLVDEWLGLCGGHQGYCPSANEVLMMLEFSRATDRPLTYPSLSGHD
jgi:hypothetical protein